MKLRPIFPRPPVLRRRSPSLAYAACGLLLGAGGAAGLAQAQVPPSAPPMAASAASRAAARPAAAPHTLWTLTADRVLHRYSLAAPGVEQLSRPVQGLPAQDPVIGMDYRVAQGQLYALTRSGRLYLLDTEAGTARPASAEATRVPMVPAAAPSMNFNPVADMLRVFDCQGHNFRLLPLTNEVVDADPATPGVQTDGALAYAATDSGFGKPACIKAVAYSYNKRDPKITTNYAIEASQGWLLRVGSLEGTTPVVSPNTGQLFTVGALGTGPLEAVAFDIADRDNEALAAVRLKPGAPTQLYRIALSGGPATLLGTLGQGAPVLGFAIEP